MLKKKQIKYKFIEREKVTELWVYLFFTSIVLLCTLLFDPFLSLLWYVQEDLYLQMHRSYCAACLNWTCQFISASRSILSCWEMGRAQRGLLFKIILVSEGKKKMGKSVVQQDGQKKSSSTQSQCLFLFKNLGTNLRNLSGLILSSYEETCMSNYMYNSC